MITYSTTKSTNKYIRLLIYGLSGVGKTRSLSTVDKNLILSSEQKLLSLKHVKIPVINVDTLVDCKAVVSEINSDKKYERFRTLSIDSGSDIAERILDEAKLLYESGWDVYGHLADEFLPWLKSLWTIKKDLVVIAKAGTILEDKVPCYNPLFPGKAVPAQIPYLFDYVLALKAEKKYNADGSEYIDRYFQTQACHQWTAKGDDSLDFKEKIDLQCILNKLKGV